MSSENQSTSAPDNNPNAAATQPEPDHKKAFGRAYWMLNSIEMFERLAYFGIRAVVPLYIMQATEPGGLHLTAIHKGWIYMWWAIFQSFLPIVTGGIADRYGYKRVLFFAISANAIGYVMMANFHNYEGFFAGILVLATGTAFFKPALQGSLAQNLTKENSSLGWGIFYWVVNIGAFAAPFISTIILGKPHSLEGWQNLFYACAIFTAINLLLLLTFKDVPSGADKTESPLQVLWRTIVNIFDARLITWLLIMSCFWLMMYQLWDLHPNFITDWVDSSMIAAHVPVDAWWEYGDRGLIQVPQQILMNLNAGLIILLIVPLSWAARKMRTLSAMLVGMSVATLGVFVAGWTMSGWILLLGIAFFSLGEMWTGPKKNEYLGLIAPPGKKGLYLGYVNIPVGVGVGIGSYLGGWVYDNYGEKATLALKELAANPALVAEAAPTIDWSDSLEKLPPLLGIERDEAFVYAQRELGTNDLATADRLREDFRYDEGQIINLGYLYVAAHEDYAEAVREGMVTSLLERAEALEARAGDVPPPETPPDTDAADTQPLPLTDVEKARELRALAEKIRARQEPFERAGLPQYLHHMPTWIDKKPVEVFTLLRELINAGQPEDQQLADSEIIDMLWDRYGDDPHVLNNLALEYLAQGTEKLREAVANLEYESPGENAKARIEEIVERVGIGRTKSFNALSQAQGVSRQELEEAIAKSNADDVFGYLASLEHRRFLAIAERNWEHSVPLLRTIVDSSPAAGKIVQAEVDERTLVERVGSIFGQEPETDTFKRLAANQTLIQKALREKDWSKDPEQARRLLRLNPYEAHAIAAAEVNHARQSVTKLLWDKYNPNFNVWMWFVAIGIIATIALGVFGQMAKRWKDMNA